MAHYMVTTCYENTYDQEVFDNIEGAEAEVRTEMKLEGVKWVNLSRDGTTLFTTHNA